MLQSRQRVNSWTRPYFGPLFLLEDVGRWVMDLGFSGVIEKFEEHWGKRLTRALLMLIGLGVAAVCMGAIWEWLISPLLSFFQTPVWGETIGSLLWVALTIGFGVAAGISIAASLGTWRKEKLTRRHFDKVEKDFDVLFAKAKSVGQTTDLNIANSIILLEASILLMKDRIEKLPAKERRPLMTKIREAEKHLATVKETPDGE